MLNALYQFAVAVAVGLLTASAFAKGFTLGVGTCALFHVLLARDRHGDTG